MRTPVAKDGANTALSGRFKSLAAGNNPSGPRIGAPGPHSPPHAVLAVTNGHHSAPPVTPPHDRPPSTAPHHRRTAPSHHQADPTRPTPPADNTGRPT
ncbi:hypothetical protein GCM10010503_00440 [Streptomyces lucensis JCM 4490]|uniref:Uncharacterized protein n=1 Tax=Streptomyces lucensis JCM 4490 TaxID=1306176 RepID=A0A918ISL6_9ACTN|nr:hypothetical protein GCM10010503_00440 [Streptomyces lucensis JCM 4490]